MLEGKVYTTRTETNLFVCLRFVVVVFVCFWFCLFFARRQIQGIEWIIIGSYLSSERAVNI